jgi:hypothetical protein
VTDPDIRTYAVYKMHPNLDKHTGQNCHHCPVRLGQGYCCNADLDMETILISQPEVIGKWRDMDTHTNDTAHIIPVNTEFFVKLL